MNAICRRDLSIVFSATTERATTTPAGPPPVPEKCRTLSDSEVFLTDRMPATTNVNGGKTWNILEGALVTGEAIALHRSLQPAGIAPHPPHTIQHSELILVQEGTLLFEHHGSAESVGPGGVIFVAIGTRHAARNVGDGTAKYPVIAMGGDTG
jgi:mannose-6-phosphate isomerase-like protein (cupin superfamily)